MNPALQIIDSQGVFIGDIFGLILALPVALFLAFWISAVKNKAAVIFGAFLGGIIGFLVILAWAGTLLFDKPLEGATGVAVFFGSLLFCSITALCGGILVDLLVARLSARDYRSQASH